MPRDPRRDSLYLADIVEAARTIARWIQRHGDDWAEDEILLNAVLRQLLVVGEAATSLSAEALDRMPEIPWRNIRGFRNQAVHAYFSMDWSIVREVATTNVPELHDSAMVVLRAEFPQVAAAFEEG